MPRMGGRGRGGKAGFSLRIRRARPVRVKRTNNRSSSSIRWLERQLNDPFVQMAEYNGYRSRAAFKLLELQKRFDLIRPGDPVIDLGAAPGGWSQVVMEYCGRSSTVVAIDLLQTAPLAGVVFIQDDFMTEKGQRAVEEALRGRRPKVILSDMAASTIGHADADHLRTLALCEAAYAFCKGRLAQGGNFVAKLFQGGAENEFLHELKRNFTEVKHVKPEASRKESSELYLVCLGYRGE
ncbi:MAG: RlmE family RNA methyltransferase [Rickettsiales bacterium]